MNIASRNPIITPGELPATKRTFPLRCQACKKSSHYRVGTIMVDPRYFDEIEHLSGGERLRALKRVHWDKWTSFSGYFLCRNCGGGGPWDILAEGKNLLVSMIIRHIFNPESSGIFLGRPQLFDGTACRNAFESVQHIERLLQADPNSAFLWSRLGNLFVGAEEPDLALPAFLKAVELDPHDIESLHSLGNYWFEKGDESQSAKYYSQVLQYCRTGTWHRPGLKENLVEHALETLLQIQHRNTGKMESLSFQLNLPPKADKRDSPVIYVREFDLSNEESRRKLVQLFLQGEAMPQANATNPPQRRNNARILQAATGRPQQRTLRRVGRNDPCPCGSGKNFKQCCL